MGFHLVANQLRRQLTDLGVGVCNCQENINFDRKRTFFLQFTDTRILFTVKGTGLCYRETPAKNCLVTFMFSAGRKGTFFHGNNKCYGEYCQITDVSDSVIRV